MKLLLLVTRKTSLDLQNTNKASMDYSGIKVTICQRKFIYFLNLCLGISRQQLASQTRWYCLDQHFKHRKKCRKMLLIIKKPQKAQ